MTKLVYSAIMSLDGYIEDENGKFDWAMPDEAVHVFFNELERPIGTYLYGRRMYATMVFWETALTLPDPPQYVTEYARIWQAADKIVFSQTLEAASSARTTIVRDFDPEAIRRMKTSAERDISIGGPNLAAQAFMAGLVDEMHLVVAPVAVGGGKPALPAQARVHFELLDEKRFGNGMVHLHYQVIS